MKTERIDPNREQGIRLLIVDDEIGFTSVMSKRLSKRGIDTQIANNGADAVQVLRRNDFHCALLDLKMEDMSGMEVLRIFKKMVPQMPVIMLTGHGCEESAKEGLALGADDYLIKPATFEEVVAKIHSLTGTTMQDNAMPDNRITALFIDDETAYLSTLVKRLKKRGINALTADSGESGISRLTERPCDIVVLDVCMPGIGGFQTLKYIKNNWPMTEVILLTGHACMESAKQGMDAGAFDYLMKPVEIDGLIYKIEDAYDKVKLTKLKRQRDIRR